MRNTLLRVAATAGLAIGLAGIGAGIAHATEYIGSSSKPLKLEGYGSTAYAYGNWKASSASDGTRSRLSGYQKLKDADNHKVYMGLETWVNAGSCVGGDLMSCTQQYYYYASTTTGHTNSESYVNKKTTTGLTAAGDYARAAVRVSLDIPWRTDKHGGWSFTGGDKY